MTSVHVTTTAEITSWNPSAQANYQWLHTAMKNDKVQKHTISNSPDDADLILIVGSKCVFYSDIINSPIYSEYLDKCFAIDTLDYTIPRIPGLYARLPNHLHNIPIYEYGFYPKLIELESRISDNEVFESHISTPEYLFSFVGAVSTHPLIRSSIMELDSSRAILIDTDNHNRLAYDEYLTIIASSKFILCPRGVGPSSHRYFEAMRMGRVPVVISDEWTHPKAPNHDGYYVHVPEHRIETIPHILQELEAEASDMGKAARNVYEAYFSISACFDWIIERCLVMKKEIPNYPNMIQRNILLESMWETGNNFIHESFNLQFSKRNLQNFGSCLKEYYKTKAGKL